MRVSTNTTSPNQNIGSNNVSQNSHILDLGKQLLEACKNGDITEVKMLVDNGAPFTTDWLGTSPLHLASQYGHSETAEYLLRAGASKDTRTKVDRTPLHVAALEGHLSIVSLLLTSGAEIDARDLLKMTPLHWATERGHYDVVEFLLAHGSDVNLQSKFDKTAIDIAIEAGHNEMIPLLESYVNTIRPKTNQNSLSTNSKSRPIILPNKSNRTQRASKSLNTSLNLNEPVIISSANGKPINIENIKKLINNSNLIKKDNNSVSSSSLNGSNVTTMNTSNVKEAMQWLEINGIASSNGKKNEDEDLSAIQQNNSHFLAVTDINKISATKLSTPNDNKNKIITIVTNNQISHLIKNTSPFVVLKSKNDTDDKNKKKIKFEKITTNMSNKFINTSQNLNKQYYAIKTDTNSVDVERLKNENEKLKEENENWKEKYEKLQEEVEKLKNDVEKIKNRK